MPRWIVRTAVAATAALMLALLSLPLWVKSAQAEITLAEHCYSYWDLALVSRAIAEERGISDEVHKRIIGRVFTPEGETAAQNIERIRTAAMATKEPALEFANRIRRGCLMFRGNLDLDLVLGVRL